MSHWVYPFLSAIITGLLLLPGQVARAETLQGFGASTPGGAEKTVYRVTSLRDSGPGSLRDAVSRGGRRVVFEVAGDISLTSDVYVRGAFITIDGTTAPAPGITLRGHGLHVHGQSGAHDVIIRGIRLRDSRGCDSCPSSGAGIGIARQAYNVLVEHVSVQGAEDQAISIGRGAHDVTVRWSIFAGGEGNSLPVLIGHRARRVSFHHNLLIGGYERMPQVMWSHDGDQATETQIDLRNNLLWDWQYAASQVWKGTKANVVANYYYSSRASDSGRRRAIYMCHAGSKPPQCDGTNPQWHGRAYIADNISGHGPTISDYLNGLGTESNPFAAPALKTNDACTAAQQVLAEAGVRPLDAVDQRYLGRISLVGCDVTHSSAGK